MLKGIIVTGGCWYTEYNVQADAVTLLYLMWKGKGVGKHRVVYHCEWEVNMVMVRAVGDLCD